MKLHSISVKQFASAKYLRSVLEEYQNLSWDQSYQKLSVQNYQAFSRTLVINAQALTLEHLAGIYQALSPTLHLSEFHLNKHDKYVTSTVINCALGHVESTAVHLDTLLAEVAAQFHCELGIVEQTPCIDEPGLLVMDMDSTVIQIECIDEIAKLAGLGEKVSAVTERAMRGELDFAESLRSRVGCLNGVAVSQLAKIRNGIPLMPGLQNLLSVLKANGWKVAIASGGFTYFAEYLEQRLGLDASRANVLAQVEGRLTGTVVGDIVDAQVKAQTVLALAEQWGIPMRQTVAMGDGANDLKMMGVAALGVAFEAKPIVNEQADVAIRFSGLDAMLAYLS